MLKMYAQNILLKYQTSSKVLFFIYLLIVFHSDIYAYSKLEYFQGRRFSFESSQFCLTENEYLFTEVTLV